MKARILIVDDHEVMREGLKSLLAKSRPELEVCGEASDGEQAIELVREQEPDIVILDITMPGMSGLETSSQMRKSGIHTPVLIFTTHYSEHLAVEVRKAGAQGYVLKSHAARELVMAIDAILAGGTFYEDLSSSGSTTEKKSKPSILFRQRFAFAT
jgi:two-component system, NarL family, invasion response regulator UvrY